MSGLRMNVFKAGLEASLEGLAGKVRLVLIMAPLPQLRHGAPECIATGRRPETDGESGLAVVRALEAATQALHGSPWEIDGFDARPGGNGAAVALGPGRRS